MNNRGGGASRVERRESPNVFGMGATLLEWRSLTSCSDDMGRLTVMEGFCTGGVDLNDRLKCPRSTPTLIGAG
jgi:hypothetical protein